MDIGPKKIGRGNNKDWRKTYTRKLQIANWQRVKELASQGKNRNQIVELSGVPYGTVCRYLNLTEPPNALGNQHHRGVRRKCAVSTSRRGRLRREFAVDPQVAVLRDQIVETFMRGDLEQYGKLCLQLRMRLKKLKELVAELSLPPEPEKLLEAAE